ncbi:SulP family inorganic anion transporter [Paractinoplanes durhamensis]|uniref:Transporter n=2 Tax=Paractinoplanes durhamensis TaxID=113563 RepID=A0ABQ3YVS0_9ACTN|nr:sulfate permease [Actinoplanes durhamensis]GIE01599.1 transporter [Actinoplanes durhamensis]
MAVDVARWVPGVTAVRSYRVAWLPRDLMAGIVLTTLLVPQGMAYAELAGLPPITGLYTSMVCLLAYAVFGPSRVLVLGPDSSLGPMIATVLVGAVGATALPAEKVGLAATLSLMVGVMLLVAGFAKLGFLADLLSHPTQVGYLNGLALTILIGQLPKLFGFSAGGDGLLGETAELMRGIAAGKVVPTAVAVGVFGLVVMLVLGRLAPRVPGVLLAVVLSTLAVPLLDLGVRVVGTLPQGLPTPELPSAGLDDLAVLAAGAIGITVVSLTDTISTASAFAARTGREVRGNQEMVGIGAANVAASFFQGFPVSTSGSRTAVAQQAGARTQLTGVVGAVAIGLLLLIAPGLLKNLPQPTLAAVVIAAAISLADLPAMASLWRRRKVEFWLAVAAFLGVAVLGVLPGMAIAVALSVLNVFRRVWWPYQAVLGRADGVDGFHDTRTYPDAAHLPGLVLFRFDAPLVFANVRVFRDRLREFARTEPGLRWIVIAAEPITDVDTTAADVLEELDRELNDAGISLVFAEMKTPVHEKVDRYQLTRVIDPAHFFPTIDDAVAAYRRETGTTWTQPS